MSRNSKHCFLPYYYGKLIKRTMESYTKNTFNVFVAIDISCLFETVLT